MTIDANSPHDIHSFMEKQTKIGGWETRGDQLVSKTLTRKDANELAGRCDTLFTKVEVFASRHEVGLYRVVIQNPLAHLKSSATNIVSVGVESIKQHEGMHHQLRVEMPREKNFKNEIEARFKDLAVRINPEIERHLTFESKVPNRFRDTDRGTRCPDTTQLKDPTTGKSFQVHANRVELDGIQMICSQAPREDSEVEFWRAALSNTHRILDLTNKSDRVEKGVQRYFPQELGDVFQKRNITATCVDEEKNVAGEKRLKLHTYHVEEEKGGDVVNQRPITRLHYRGWPDHGAVATKDLAIIVNQIRTQPEALGNEPLWIHCRAGVGRTGTVAVALALAKMKSEGRLTEQNYVAQIDNLIIKGRSQRDIFFVQSVEQYQLLHDFARGLLDGSVELK